MNDLDALGARIKEAIDSDQKQAVEQAESARQREELDQRQHQERIERTARFIGEAVLPRIEKAKESIPTAQRIVCLPGRTEVRGQDKNENDVTLYVVASCNTNGIHMEAGVTRFDTQLRAERHVSGGDRSYKGFLDQDRFGISTWLDSELVRLAPAFVRACE